MAEISLPLFVRAKDSGEVYKFGSMYEMQHALEKIDVENQEYEAWDRHGTPVELIVEEPIWLKVVPASEKKDDRLLRDALFQFAQAVGVQLPEELTPNTFEAALD